MLTKVWLVWTLSVYHSVYTAAQVTVTPTEQQVGTRGWPDSSNFTASQLNFLFQEYYVYDSNGLLYRYNDGGFVCGDLTTSLCMQSNARSILSVFRESTVYPISLSSRTISVNEDIITVRYDAINETSPQGRLIMAAIISIEVLENLLSNSSVNIINTIVLPEMYKILATQSMSTSSAIIFRCNHTLIGTPFVSIVPHVNGNLSDSSISVYSMTVEHRCACPNLSPDALIECEASVPVTPNPVSEFIMDNVDLTICVVADDRLSQIFIAVAVLVCLMIWIADLARVLVRPAVPRRACVGCGAILLITPPINFLDGTASFTVACITGCMSEIIFKLIVAGTSGAVYAFSDITQILPMFLCYFTQGHLFGSVLGALYSAAFSVYQWIILGCYARNQSAYLTLFSLPSAFFSACVCGAFVWSVWKHTFGRRCPECSSYKPMYD